MADAEVPDRELVRRIREGDEAAYGTLVRRYLRPAVAVAREYVRELADAEDIVQDAFYRALRGIDRYDVERAFAPWFFTIVRNAGRNAASRDRRWRFVRLPDRLAAPGLRQDPAERRELRDRLDEAIDGLPQRQRACFRLCEIEGYTRGEVADMLNIGESTVRVHLHRARDSLREALGGADFAHGDRG